MNRRKLLTFIGFAPFVPVAAKAAEPIDDGWYPVLSYTPWTGGNPTYAQFTAVAGGGPGNGLVWYDRLVCENHHDNAWPEECKCGPGMRTCDTLRS